MTIPDEHVDDRKKLWQFQNELADGNIANDNDEVFVAQWRRILAGQESSNFFPATDIGLKNPHQFQIGMRVYSTNLWRQKFDRESVRPSATANEVFRSIIVRQLENIPSCKDVYDCLGYIRELWCKNIRQGIASWSQQRDLHLMAKHMVEELEAGRIPVVPQWEAPAPFCRIVGEVVQGLDEESTIQQWLVLLENNSANQCAHVKISSAFEAALLWKWKMEGATINPKKFDNRYGQSRQNDIAHISTFVPYVDALTTDQDMRNLCKDEVVADELKQFSCKIFSKSNYDEFESWLDVLLAEHETYDVRV